MVRSHLRIVPLIFFEIAHKIFQIIISSMFLVILITVIFRTLDLLNARAVENFRALILFIILLIIVISYHELNFLATSECARFVETPSYGVDWEPKHPTKNDIESQKANQREGRLMILAVVSSWLSVILIKFLFHQL